MALVECQRLSKTCSSQPAVIQNLDANIVYMCCLDPQFGCATASGSKDDALHSVEDTLAQANYSNCAAKAVISARDGLSR
jgi:hypothetical protein